MLNGLAVQRTGQSRKADPIVQYQRRQYTLQRKGLYTAKAVSSNLQTAHDSKIDVHFNSEKHIILIRQFSSETQVVGCKEVYRWVYEVAAI